MSAPKRALLLIGSPRVKGSNSASLGEYLLGKLQEAGLEGQSLRLLPAMASEERRAELPAAVAEAELIVLSAPLYVDSLPAWVISALELIAADRKGKTEGPRLVAIVNCGFPEAHQNHVALEIYRRFAEEAGMSWAGGLALGGGEMLQGKPLAQVGGMAQHLRKALDLTATALAAGEGVPEQAMRLFAKRMAPTWLYARLGAWGMRRAAKKHGATARLYDRPLEQ